MSTRIRNGLAIAGIMALVFAQGLASGQQVSARPSPFDGDDGIISVPRTVDVFHTLAFLLDEVDLNTLGVSDVELALAGPSGASSSSHDECSHERWCSHNDVCPHHTRMLLVDDDRAQCPNAQYVTIQSAVDAVNAGDKIKVCPGTYVEQVTIPSGKDNITLFSHVPSKAVIKAPLVMLEPTTKAIVRVNGAKNVTIRHFTITGPGSGGCDSLRWGVRVDDGGSSAIVGNHITDIRDEPFSGCQNGIGVLIGRDLEAQTASGIVVHNLIDRYQKGGVVVDGIILGQQSRGDVGYNLIDGAGVSQIIAQNGVQISRNAVGDVHHNRIARNNFGLLSFVSEGIILFRENPDSMVRRNHSSLNDDGVGLFGSQGTEVSRNRAEFNDFDGIFANADTSNNTIAFNRAEDNAEHDCHDDSVGTGTAGTANFWIKNRGATENRPGLCKK